MKRIAILCNGNSSQITDRRELVDLCHDKNIKPYCGRVFDGIINEYFREDTAICLPIVASRTNTNPIGEIESLLSIIKQIKKNKIDSVIIYGVKNHAAMAIGSWLGGAKKIVCVVNGSGNLFRVTGIKGTVLRFMAFPMLRIAYKHSTSICFQNSDDLKLFLKKKLIKDRYDCFVTGGSGVNLDAFPNTPIPNEYRFLFLSRITATKGLKEFCEAARLVKEQYPDTIFDIVGPLDSTVESGEIKETLDKAETDGVVKYHGFTTNVANWIQQCRVFVYPSYYPEGIPRCVLQALSTGRPIITCNTPGCKETVIDGYNGFLIEPRNIDELAQKMIWMFENDDQLETMGKASRDLAELKFDVNKINEELISHL